MFKERRFLHEKDVHVESAEKQEMVKDRDIIFWFNYEMLIIVLFIISVALWNSVVNVSKLQIK